MASQCLHAVKAGLTSALQLHRSVLMLAMRASLRLCSYIAAYSCWQCEPRFGFAVASQYLYAGNAGLASVSLWHRSIITLSTQASQWHCSVFTPAMQASLRLRSGIAAYSRWQCRSRFGFAVASQHHHTVNAGFAVALQRLHAGNADFASAS